MTKAPSAADVSGFIYTFEIRGELRPGVSNNEILITVAQTSLIPTISTLRSGVLSTSRSGWTSGINSAEQSKGSISFVDGGPAPLTTAATL